MNIFNFPKYIIISLVLILSIVSIAKYFNVSTCCQPTTCSSIPIYQDACATEPSSTLSHHYDMINSLTISIFNQTITFNILNLSSILLLLVSSLIYYKLRYIKLREKSKYLSLKYLFNLLGNHIHSFDELRFLFSKGIIGSKKQFA